MSRFAVYTQTWQRPKVLLHPQCCTLGKIIPSLFLFFSSCVIDSNKMIAAQFNRTFFFLIPLLQPKQSRIWEKSSSTSQKILSLVRAKTCSTAAEGMGLTRITSPLSLSMNVLLSHQDSLKRLLFKFHTFCAIHSPLTYLFVFVLNCQSARNAGRGRV